MRIRRSLIVVAAVALISGGFLVGRTVEKKGTPDSSSAPGVTSSYTLEDIYNRLDTGAPGTPGTFTEPTSGPGTGTMHTLDDIMAKAGTACTQCNPPGTLVGTRWCDNGDGTVTDMTTGLVWLQEASWGGLKKWEDCTGHDDAHTRAGLLKAADYAWLSDGSVEGDWRLPTLGELKALTSGTEPVSLGDMRAFSGVQSFYYWSSTTYANDMLYAWVVLMDDGNVLSDAKDAPDSVWPVRGP